MAKGLHDLESYCAMYKAFLKRAKVVDSDAEYTSEADIKRLDEMMQLLREAIGSTKDKNVQILTLAADISRKMNGGRLMCCKSGKVSTTLSRFVSLSATI